MSDLYLPVKVLSKGWKQIEFSDRFFENGTSIARSIPNDILLDELIRIPQSSDSDFDPFELQKYRNKFFPQKYDYKNQTLLRNYSNNLVEGLIEKFSIHKNQCEVDKFLRSFCTRHNINYENHRYDLLLKSYCMNILPFRRPSRDDKRQIEGVREGIYGKCKTGSDFMQVNSYIKIDGIQIFGVSLREIEEEFEKEIIDANFSRKIDRKKKESERIIKERKKLEEDRMEINLVEALRTWRFSEFAVAMRSVKSFNNQILCKREIQEYNQAVNADSERSRKKLREYEGKKGAIPCLRQCLFCYRFKLGTGNISRTCGSRKCKGFETEILESIGEENRKYLKF